MGTRSGSARPRLWGHSRLACRVLASSNVCTSGREAGLGDIGDEPVGQCLLPVPAGTSVGRQAVPVPGLTPAERLALGDHDHGGGQQTVEQTGGDGVVGQEAALPLKGRWLARPGLRRSWAAATKRAWKLVATAAGRAPPADGTS